MAASASSRIDGIDFWRGFALLTIFVDHAPDNIFQRVPTHGNFGFSDAAELFVFFSGTSVALAYGSRFFRGETVSPSAQFFAVLSLFTGCRCLSRWQRSRSLSLPLFGG